MDGTMARKHHKPEEIVGKLRQVDVLTGQGRSIAEAVKTIAVTETTYFHWRAEYGGMKNDQVKRLKALELENTRPRTWAGLPNGGYTSRPPAVFQFRF